MGSESEGKSERFINELDAAPSAEPKATLLVFFSSSTLFLSLSRLACTFSARSYLCVILPVSVMMSRAIPHVQECLNEPHFVTWRLGRRGRLSFG